MNKACNPRSGRTMESIVQEMIKLLMEVSCQAACQTKNAPKGSTSRRRNRKVPLKARKSAAPKGKTSRRRNRKAPRKSRKSAGVKKSPGMTYRPMTLQRLTSKTPFTTVLKRSTPMVKKLKTKRTRKVTRAKSPGAKKAKAGMTRPMKLSRLASSPSGCTPCLY